MRVGLIFDAVGCANLVNSCNAISARDGARNGCRDGGGSAVARGAHLEHPVASSIICGFRDLEWWELEQRGVSGVEAQWAVLLKDPPDGQGNERSGWSAMADFSAGPGSMEGKGPHLDSCTGRTLGKRPTVRN